MLAIKLRLASKTLLDPRASQWEKSPAERISMSGTRADLQPSAYIRAAWAARPVGAVRTLDARAAHNGEMVFFRMEWPDDTQNSDWGDGSVFPDAAAALLPLRKNAPLDTMGSAREPVSIWYWRADRTGNGEHLVSRGFGSEEPTKVQRVAARSRWESGYWSVVIAHPLQAKGQDAPGLEAGKATQVAFAVWEGAAQERAGLHSCSREWRTLEIE